MHCWILFHSLCIVIYCAGALQFKEEYEKAMAANDKLLGADDAGEEDDEEADEEAAGADGSAQVSDLTDALGKVRETLTLDQVHKHTDAHGAGTHRDVVSPGLRSHRRPWQDEDLGPEDVKLSGIILTVSKSQ